MNRLLTCLCVSLCIGCANPNVEQHVNESLIYLKSKDGNFDLYKSDLLGQWEERLTNNPGWDWAPNWIPALKEFTYYTNDTSRNFSWVVRSVKESEVDTLPKSQLLNLKLSPDGKWIYYNAEAGESKAIRRQKLNENVDELLVESEGYNGRFSIDASHSQMAFISDRTGSNQLFLMDLNTKTERQITSGSMISKYNSFSPDGKQIAVCRAMPAEDPKWDVYIIDLETGEQKQLTDTPYSEQEIAWSLSGDKIAFHGTSENDGNQIYTIDIADGKFTKITSGEFYHGEPAWVLN